MTVRGFIYYILCCISWSPTLQVQIDLKKSTTLLNGDKYLLAEIKFKLCTIMQRYEGLLSGDREFIF